MPFFYPCSAEDHVAGSIYIKWFEKHHLTLRCGIILLSAALKIFFFEELQYLFLFSK